MRALGVDANTITFSALINACGKCRQWQKALEVFALMKDKVELNVL
jgi:pentatricopeptide repeat domain-containing protein 1